MSRLRRVIRYDAKDPLGSDCYDEVCDGLAGEAAGWLGELSLAGWPYGRWAGDGRSVRCSEWRPDPPLRERLLHLELRQEEENGQALTIAVTLGCSGAGAPFLIEDWTLVPSHRPLELAALPILFVCVTPSPALDEDGLLAGARYTVSAKRVPALTDFLLAPTRRLPLLLLSPLGGEEDGFSLGPSPTLIAASRGIAHVVRLQDEAAVEIWRSRLLRHGCYDGAVRLYWPSFRPDDRVAAHPFKAAREIAHRGWEQIEQWAFNQLSDYAARQFAHYEELAELERAQDRAFHEQQRERNQQRERLADAPDLEALYYEVERERNEARERADVLTNEVARLKDELRRERWKNHSLFTGHESQDEKGALVATLYFSVEARRRWRTLDPSEQRYWEQHLLPKLLHPQQREAQSVRVTGALGSAWVYPRSRSCDGRRVIYYCQQEHVFVCELYPATVHDEAYNRARTDGVDVAEYGDFQPWTLEAPNQE